MIPGRVPVSAPVFDRVSHKYYDDFGELPSVTKILSEGGILPDYSFADPFPAIRGTYVHALCAAFDKGEDPATVPEPPECPFAAAEPYLDGYREFVTKKGIKWDVIEEPFAHPVYRYAGIPDRAKRVDVVLDIKTGVRGSGEPLQLAGYWDLLIVNGITVRPRGVFLYLTAKGKAYPEDVENLNGLALIFQAVKTANDYRKKRR